MLRSALVLAGALLPLRAVCGQTLTLMRATPDAVGLSSAMLDEAEAAFEGYPEARALLVARHGAIVVERYFRGVTAETAWNVKSVSKSVQSALAGIALDEGLLEGLDQRVADIIPEFFPPLRDTLDLGWESWLATSDSLRREITLRDILTMRTGFVGSDLDGTYVAMLAHAPDQVSLAAGLPLDGPPGARFQYNTANAMLLNGLLAAAVGVDPLSFARERLFAPIGGGVQRWRTDQMGLPIGGAELYLTARDMLRFGLLYMGGGEIEGTRILSADFVNASLAPQVQFALPPEDAAAALLPNSTGYGYMWWHRRSGAHDMTCAWGYGGQFICLVRDLDLVVVTLSTLQLNAEFHRRLFDVVDRLVVNAAESR